jgi:hypothetical protein
MPKHTGGEIEPAVQGGERGRLPPATAAHLVVPAARQVLAVCLPANAVAQGTLYWPCAPAARAPPRLELITLGSSSADPKARRVHPPLAAGVAQAVRQRAPVPEAVHLRTALDHHGDRAPLTHIHSIAHRFRQLELEQGSAVDLIPPKVAQRIGNAGTPKAGTSSDSSSCVLVCGGG